MHKIRRSFFFLFLLAMTVFVAPTPAHAEGLTFSVNPISYVLDWFGLARVETQSNTVGGTGGVCSQGGLLVCGRMK